MICFVISSEDWEKDVRTFRCALSAEDVKRYRGDATGWDCNDIHFVVDMVSFSDLGPDVATNSARPRPPSACPAISSMR